MSRAALSGPWDGAQLTAAKSPHYQMLHLTRMSGQQNIRHLIRLTGETLL